MIFFCVAIDWSRHHLVLDLASSAISRLRSCMASAILSMFCLQFLPLRACTFISQSWVCSLTSLTSSRVPSVFWKVSLQRSISSRSSLPSGSFLPLSMPRMFSISVSTRRLRVAARRVFSRSSFSASRSLRVSLSVSRHRPCISEIFLWQQSREMPDFMILTLPLSSSFSEISSQTRSQSFSTLLSLAFRSLSASIFSLPSLCSPRISPSSESTSSFTCASIELISPSSLRTSSSTSFSPSRVLRIACRFSTFFLRAAVSCLVLAIRSSSASSFCSSDSFSLSHCSSASLRSLSSLSVSLISSSYRSRRFSASRFSSSKGLRAEVSSLCCRAYSLGRISSVCCFFFSASTSTCSSSCAQTEAGGAAEGASEAFSLIFFLSFCSLLAAMFQSSRLVLTMPARRTAASSFSLREMPSLASNSLTRCSWRERVAASRLWALLSRRGLLSSAVRLMLCLRKFLLMVIGRTYPRYFCLRAARAGCVHSCDVQLFSHLRSSRFCSPVPLRPFSPPSAEPSLLMTSSRKRLRKGTEGLMSSLSSNCVCSSWKRLWLSLAIERKRWALPESAWTSLVSTLRNSRSLRATRKTSSARKSLSAWMCSGRGKQSRRAVMSMPSDSSITYNSSRINHHCGQLAVAAARPPAARRSGSTRGSCARTPRRAAPRRAAWRWAR